MRIAVLFTTVIFLFAGCSLKYEEGVNAEEKNPEFIFYDTKIMRYEDAKKTAEIHAEQLEQYKDSNETYAKNVSFTLYDASNNVDTEGFCGLLNADSSKELYELYDGIRLFNKKNNTNFRADVLRWNGKSEQLTGGRTDMVRLEKDGTVIVGSGFSASGISGKFNFTGSVSGDIETDSKKQENSSQADSAEAQNEEEIK